MLNKFLTSNFKFRYHFSLLKKEFQKPKKLKESPLNPPLSPFACLQQEKEAKGGS